MQKLSIKSDRKYYIGIVILSIIIFTYSIFDLRYLTGIQHVFDESGYWSAAAYLARLDWKELASYNLYYSYGYGVILALILKLIPGSYLYQTAVIINAIILVLEFQLICLSLNKIFKEINSQVLLWIAFFITVYPYNLFYVHLTVSEILLSCLYWLIIYILVNLFENNRYMDWVKLAIILSFSYAVHQRCIGVIIAAMLTVIIFILLRKTKQKRKFIVFFSMLLVLILCGNFVKNNYINSYFSTSSRLALNDYSGQVSKLDLIFSTQGIEYVIFGVIGKWFGLCCSTFMLVSIGLYGLLKKSFCEISNIYKKEQGYKLSYINIFFIISFLATFAISVIYMIDPVVYADYLIYTRYTEFAMLPILIYGIYRFYIKDISFKEIFINIIVVLAMLILVVFRIHQTGLNNYVGQANVAIWDLYSTGKNIDVFLCQSTFRAIVILGFIFILTHIKRHWNMCIVLLAVFWLYVGGTAYQKDNASRLAFQDVKQINTNISSLTNFDTLYYYNYKGVSISLDVFYIQLQNPRNPIKVLTSWSMVEEMQAGSYLLVNNLEEIDLKSWSDFEVLKKNNSFVLLRKK